MSYYILELYIGGVCRNNHSKYLPRYGGAAVYHPTLHNLNIIQPLNAWQRPTNNRALLTAVLLALESARRRQRRLTNNPEFYLTVMTTSMYIVSSMNRFRHVWQKNGYRTYTGAQVANIDLLQKIFWQIEAFEVAGDHVNFEWIDGDENMQADALAVQAREMAR